jgi:hypothetical protein
MLLDDERTDHEHVAAVLPTVVAAAAAVAQLRDEGFGSEHLGVAVREGTGVAFERDDDADYLHDVTRGAAIGAPVGALAGIGLVAAAAPWVGVGGLLALAAAGTLGGTFLGAFGGMLRGQPSRDEHLALTDRVVPDLVPGEVLVVCLAHGAGERARAVLAAHGGRAVAA